jgi:hypothetical protein
MPVWFMYEQCYRRRTSPSRSPHRVTPRGCTPSAVLLGIVTATTKVLTGFWAARRTGVDRRGGFRSGMALVARGEFSIVIAGLGAGLEPQLGPLAAAYVLFLAVLGQFSHAPRNEGALSPRCADFRWPRSRRRRTNGAGWPAHDSLPTAAQRQIQLDQRGQFISLSLCQG